jgi:hypothetical protein
MLGNTDVGKKESDPPPQPKKKKKVKKEKVRSRAEAIDQVYNDHEEVESKKELSQIEIPKIRPNYESLYKRITAVMAVIIIGLVLYWFFGVRGGGGEVVEEPGVTTRWYAVKLVTEETFYGQIEDTGADPVVIKNVYYNYDQLSEESGSEAGEGGGNLRLVKRGKETHGPEGTMNIVRAQVVYMEPLKDESKVLKAILDYEN